jgi:cytochrome c oxidase assembly factor CtaG
LGRGAAWDNGDTAFALGIGALLLALISPISFFDTTLQWDHMVQHVLLLLVAPPLILLADPFRTAWAGYLAAQGRPIAIDATAPARVMRTLHAGPKAAAIVVLAFSVDLLVWHVPSIYNATLRIASVHDLEHLTFLVVGLLFWDQVISPIRAAGRLSLLGRAVVVLVGMFVSWGLAIVIGYATHPLYAYPTPTGGLSLLGDQEIAAGVMWVPGGTPFLIALLYLGIRWFELDDRSASNAVGVQP